MRVGLRARGEVGGPRQPQRGEQADERPGRVELSPAHAEARRGGKFVVVVVQAFAGREPGDRLQIGGGVGEGLVADDVADAVDDRVQENVEAGLEDIGHPARERPQQEKEEQDAERGAQDAVAKDPPVQPVVSDVGRKAGERLRVAGFAQVIESVAEQDAAQAFQLGAMGVALLVGVAVVLAMHRHPLFGDESREQPHLQSHEKGGGGMQHQGPVGETTVQINRGAEGRDLHGEEDERQRVQPDHDSSPGRNVAGRASRAAFPRGKKSGSRTDPPGSRVSLELGDVGGLEPLGALGHLKLHRRAFREVAIALTLDGGIVDENVFARLALDKPVALRGVEPLDRTLLSSVACHLGVTPCCWCCLLLSNASG